MVTLFENKDFALKTTGHGYDFVGIIETKTKKPLTFFFEEIFYPMAEDKDEFEVDESQTRLLDVYGELEPFDGDTDEAEDIANLIGATSWFRTRDDKSTGFISDPQERGQFLALVKNYCPDNMKYLSWA